ncbi:Fructose dehydrogenase large subunit [Falsiruegeria litorea R37]|uniref:Fructose dehydrogenase large subunit n=1 Tax=Falsiruegeria litorea R37 TaxID=1200284 RepID=A0A1Y5S0P8_9RHOB|nr:GMC family oxidoreductase [Falsiruegeria litorea]SLN26945.1 Fructose dehydrogenase large subunit [Falsiruegeria litorea R37]
MSIQSLNEVETSNPLRADLVVVGGGACGLTLARAMSGQGRRIIVLESGGLDQDAKHEALNVVRMDGWSPEEAAARDRYHRTLTHHWAGDRQQYGVRCRGLGGATQAWAGKSAPLDQIDFEERDWVPFSGWPMSETEVAPFLKQASHLLNLGPAFYDARLWMRLRHEPPAQSPEGDALRTMFWQFARSRRQVTDIMRFGPDFRANMPGGVQVLTEATVTSLHSNAEGSLCTGLSARSLAGKEVSVEAPICVLASGAIENARLLLMSDLGNRHDTVGRFLMDHPTTTVARAAPDQVTDLASRFGLFGLRDQGQSHVYMYGLALTDQVQRAESLLNGAVFVTEERAPDDPFAALRRLLRGQSKARLSDMGSVLRSPVRLARGAGARMLERGYLPERVSRGIADTALRLFPNTLARDHRFGRLPVKLSGVRFEATTEHPPDPGNRVTLSQELDPLGLPVPHVTWSPGDAARSNLLQIGRKLCESFEQAGLPPLIPEPWVREGQPRAATVIDLGHSLGTTRMADDPARGVVDRNCAVHGVTGLYAVGGSVFPTSGHANPTLMMIALTLRLADHLRGRV